MAEGKLIGPNHKPVVCVFEGGEGGSTTFLERFRAMLPPIEAGLLHILDGRDAPPIGRMAPGSRKRGVAIRRSPPT